MSRKETILRCSSEIEALSNTVRKWISEQNEKPGYDELLEYTEKCFFESELMDNVELQEIRTVIESVFNRVNGKYGILNNLILDNSVNEIMVNGPDMIFVEKNRAVVPVDDAFLSEDELEEQIRMFASDVHREINEANPIVDARLDNGYRINGVLRNIALNGPILTIRKFSDKDIELSDLVKYGTITEKCAEDLSALVYSGYNVFISGGTSSGKTTFLNALAAAIKPEERVIIIEDSAELRINQLKNKVHMECRNANSIGKGEVTMAKLIRTSLRMRPDRIIVGEVRGREVVDMIQAMNTGHEGSLSTGHGNSVKGMLSRLETMYLMDSQIPMHSVKSQIANAIDIFVHLRRESTGERRVVEIAEMLGFDGVNYELNYLYTNDEKGELKRTTNPLVDRERLNRAGYGSCLKSGDEGPAGQGEIGCENERI